MSENEHDAQEREVESEGEEHDGAQETPPVAVVQSSPPPPLPPPVAKKTVEEWGLAKGFLPQELPKATHAAAATLKLGNRTLLGIATKHNPKFWRFAAAKGANGWLVGFEIAEADFDREIEKHTNLPHG